MTRGECSVCRAPLGERNTSGFCKRHSTAFNNRRPEVRAKRSATLKRYLSDPAVRAAHVERLVTSTQAPEVRERAVRNVTRTRLAHVPEDYRPAYRQLRRQHVPAAECLRLVLDQRDADLAKFRRSIGR